MRGLVQHENIPMSDSLNSFDVSEDKAKHLIREVGNTLPGYLVPRLVREVPGEKSKQPIPLI